jgi:glycosyltransferase involved in cell wall biosynthesis
MQTYKNIEVIIVDAGSTDTTNRIIDNFRPLLNIKDFLLEKSTQSEARNHGLANATGKYLAFCDSDDFYLPTKLSLQVADLEYSHADVSHFDVLHFYTHNNEELFINHHTRHHDILFECILNQSINLNSILIRKSFIDFHKIIFPLGEMGRYSEDGNFIYQLALHNAEFNKLNESLSVVEVRADSHTQWDAQWKMKYFAIQYRIESKTKLPKQYHAVLDKSIRDLTYKLVISLILANKYKEAKDSLKEIVSEKYLWFLNVTFTILNIIPNGIVRCLIIGYWDRYRSKHKRRYIKLEQASIDSLVRILNHPITVK